jgi:hypothetical protein
MTSRGKLVHAAINMFSLVVAGAIIGAILVAVWAFSLLVAYNG